jgi:ABC-2 type transport system ATP-binding protein
MTAPTTETTDTTDTTPMVQTRGLRKQYGEFTAVHGLDLAVMPGEVFGFLGPNGAGKTTSLRMITGLLAPSAGEVLIHGRSLAKEPLVAKSWMSFIPDRPYIYEKLTAVEFLQFCGGLYGMKKSQCARRIEELLSLFDLARWGGSLVENFSHGMKQRLVVASALLPRPKLLVVDEPMVGLDPRGARLIKQIFRQICSDSGMTVFLSTHSLDVAEELCDRIAIMHHGQVVREGTLASLRTELDQPGERLEEIFLQITEEEEEEGASDEQLIRDITTSGGAR